jgi:hypothetical protein
MWTSCGGRFWPLDPRAEDVHLTDIARGLANRCRYQGQIGVGTGYRYYSVAEHSVIVSMAAEKVALNLGHTKETARAWALEALLHDASEAYIADVARPLKYSREMRGYCKIEARVEKVIREALGVNPTQESSAVIKILDNRILVDEIRAFMHTPGKSEDDFIERWGEPLECAIGGLPPGQAEFLFFQRYQELCPGELVAPSQVITV